MPDRIEGLIDEASPRGMIWLELDPGEWAVRLEHVAANALDFEIADNAGKILRGPVAAGGADVLHSTLPLDEIESRLRARNIPVRGSGDAGRYLCNAVMYLALSVVAHRRPPPPCGFIHLPFLPEQAGDAASLPLETMVDAARIAIATTLERC
jgi:pyroglutamyl-peptidase